MESKSRLRAVREQIEAEVRGAIRDVLTARKRIEAARETVKWTQEQIDGVRRKFEAGISTSYEVLQVLDDLAKAQTGEIKALFDYKVGESKLRLAEGSILEKYHIEVKKPPRFVFRDAP
jgi:outer membrane protein